MPEPTLTNGVLFQHARLLDTGWTPGPGERYADAPPAVCRVTAVRHGRIYYRIGREPGPARHYFHAADAASHVRRILT